MHLPSPTMLSPGRASILGKTTGIWTVKNGGYRHLGPFDPPFDFKPNGYSLTLPLVLLRIIRSADFGAMGPSVPVGRMSIFLCSSLTESLRHFFTARPRLSST